MTGERKAVLVVDDDVGMLGMKELFTDLCVAVYHQTTALVEELQERLGEAYER